MDHKIIFEISQVDKRKIAGVRYEMEKRGFESESVFFSPQLPQPMHLSLKN